MIRINHPKNLRLALAVILISGSLMVIGCNNKSKSETKETDTTKVVNADSMAVKDNTNMMGDTTKTDTTKGEQTPPPK